MAGPPPSPLRLLAKKALPPKRAIARCVVGAVFGAAIDITRLTGRSGGTA